MGGVECGLMGAGAKGACGCAGGGGRVVGVGAVGGGGLRAGSLSGLVVLWLSSSLLTGVVCTTGRFFLHPQGGVVVVFEGKVCVGCFPCLEAFEDRLVAVFLYGDPLCLVAALCPGCVHPA